MSWWPKRKNEQSMDDGSLRDGVREIAHNTKETIKHKLGLTDDPNYVSYPRDNSK